MTDANNDGVVRKRVADRQLRADRDEDGSDDESVTTPQLASPEEIAKRFIIRARPAFSNYTAAGGGSSSSKAATEASEKRSGGFFKFLASMADNNTASSPPALPRAFSSDKNVPHSNGTSTSAAQLFSSGVDAAKTLAEGSAPGVTSTTPAFSTGLPASSTVPASDSTQSPQSSEANRNNKSNVGDSGDNKDSNNRDSGSKNATDGKNTKDTHAATSKVTAPLFADGAFSFANAVDSFVEARRKMENTQTDPDRVSELGQSHSGHAGAPVRARADEDDGHTSGTECETTHPAESLSSAGTAVAPTTGEVLASASTKLFAFVKQDGGGAAGSWVERGAGEAKIKKQHRVSGSESSADARDAPPSEDAQHVVYRLLVRDGYSLNVTLVKNSFVLTKAEAKHIVFTVATKDGVVTYLLRFVGPSAELASSKFAAELKKVLDIVNQVEPAATPSSKN